MTARVWIRGVALALATTAALPAAADAVTVGTTAQPPGSTTASCETLGSDQVVFQTGSGSPSWTVPVDGVLTSWSTVLDVAPSPGATARMAVLRPDAPDTFGSSSFEGAAVAVDQRALPSSRPADGVVTFALTPAIPVRAGDRLAAGTGLNRCAVQGGGIPAGQGILAAELSPFDVGARIGRAVSAVPQTRLSISAELQTNVPVGLAAQADPSAPGRLTPLSLSVTNGSASTTATGTVAVAVPDGLAVERAVVADGTCAVAGQAVTCPIRATPGGTVPVVVLVRPVAAGSYAFTATLDSPEDSSRGDDTATATLDVVAPAAAAGSAPPPLAATPPATVPVPSAGAARRCVLPRMRGLPVRVVRRLLPQLGCRTQRVRRTSSRTVRRGLVIRTTPGAGRYAEGRRVTVVVSAGKPKPRRRR